MPRLSSLGSAVMGIAGEVMSIDGSTPAALAAIPSGGWDWLTDTLALGPAEFTPNDWRLYTYDTGTLAVAELSTAAGNSTTLKAGGAVWASWVSDSGVIQGVTTSIGGLGPFPLGYVLGVSRQGEAGLETIYLADSGIRVYSQTGTLLDQVNATLQYNDRLFVRDGVLSYALVGGGWRLRDYRAQTNLSLLLRDDAVDQCVPIVTGADVWLFERNNVEALTLRLKDSTTAWAVRPATVNEYFYLDAILLSPGVIRVGWANTIGELPDSLFLMDITLATGANDLGVVVAGAVVFTPQAALSTTTVTGTLIPGGSGGGGAGGPGSPGAGVIAANTPHTAPLLPPRPAPHVVEIADFPTKQSLTLAWDRLGDHREQIARQTARLDQQAETIAALRAMIDTLNRRVP